jgi:hypothetical protein
MALHTVIDISQGLLAWIVLRGARGEGDA